ncbi:plasmid replication protein RepC [Marivita hallyeonensis]|nr:plasmid replication protein RepC [Marivita hallyeonensis]
MSARPTGWRKATASLAVAEKLAEAGVNATVPKSRAFLAVKRVGAQIGLKAGDLMLLDTLAAFTQPQDWEQGRRPIVWPSNAYLVDRTGFSLSALKRHTRRLADAGVIAFCDSPNGKRWGHRDAEGVIVEAYGIDLSPLAARAMEFEELHTQLQNERALCQRLKRQITVTRRMIRARIEAALTDGLNGPWERYLAGFETLLGKLPRRGVGSEGLEHLLAGFHSLLAQVEHAYLAASRVDNALENPRPNPAASLEKSQEMDPKEPNYEPHIQTTKYHGSVIRNPKGNEPPATLPVKPAFENEDRGATPKPPSERVLDIRTVMQACPEFAFWARNMVGCLRDWGDLFRAACDLTKMIGVSDRTWHTTQSIMGKQTAVTAMALVFDKHAKGEVSSAGGYLRGMARKSGTGDLNLERSIYGRLSGQGA